MTRRKPGSPACHFSRNDLSAQRTSSLLTDLRRSGLVGADHQKGSKLSAIPLFLSPRGDAKSGPNMRQDLRRFVVDEMSDLVIRNTAQLGPFAERANGWLIPFRE